MVEHEIGTLSDSFRLIQPVVSGRGAVSGRHCRDSPFFRMMWREVLIGYKGGIWEMWKFRNDLIFLDQDSRNIEVDHCQV